MLVVLATPVAAVAVLAWVVPAVAVLAARHTGCSRCLWASTPVPTSSKWYPSNHCHHTGPILRHKAEAPVAVAAVLAQAPNWVAVLARVPVAVLARVPATVPTLVRMTGKYKPHHPTT